MKFIKYKFRFLGVFIRTTNIISFLCLLGCVSEAFALDAPFNLRIAKAETSRTSGVAPLIVNFSACQKESSPNDMPFHDREYSWDFGDSAADTWGTSGKSKNIEKGPVTAHVYETPGIYTATLTVLSSTGTIETQSFSITVLDPDVVFSGAKTTCLSTTSDFTGCPVGANRVVSNDLSILSAYTDAGERVLLRRGASWNVNTTGIAFPNNSGPVHIGAFGTCTSTDELGICSNAPAVTLGSGSRFINLDHKNDWRLAEISFSGAGDSAIASGYTNVKNQLFLKLKSTGLGTPIGLSHWRLNDTDYAEGISVVSCKITDFTTYSLYLGAERMSIMGNVLQNSATGHVCRVWQAYKTVISHNIISGSSLTNIKGQHALKLHSSSPIGSQNPNGNAVFVGTLAQTGNGGLRNFTQFAVVSNNVFGSSAPWTVSIGPQDSGVDERVSDLIFEKNRVIADYGRQNHTSVMIGLMFEGRYISVRNNIIDGTGGYEDYIGISVARRGVEWTPLGNRVYNNTIYSQKNHIWGAYGVKVDATANDTIIRNNYVSFPNTSSKTLLIDNSGRAVVGNNLMGIPYFVAPNNSAPLSRDFSLTPSATQAIGQGYATPVFDDFLGKRRTPPYAIGAFLF